MQCMTLKSLIFTCNKLTTWVTHKAQNLLRLTSMKFLKFLKRNIGESSCRVVYIYLTNRIWYFFQKSWGGKLLLGGENSRAPPPLYETLYMVIPLEKFRPGPSQEEQNDTNFSFIAPFG